MNVKQKLTVAALCATLIVTQTACGVNGPGVTGNQQMTAKSDFLLNTHCTIQLYDGSPEEWITEAFALCRRYEAQFSRTVADSDVGRINEAGGEYVQVEEETLEVIAQALNYGRLSGGMFDITVGELSELWDFGGEPSLPSEEEIDSVLSRVGFEHVRIMGDTVAVESGAHLDLGAIAKGHIAQKAADFLRERGVTSAILNFGGDVVTIGEKPDGSAFAIGIQEPYGMVSETAAELVGSVEARNTNVFTSGVYERQFAEDGVTYHHVLNPKTGYPVETDLLGVTIMGEDAAACDAIATTCLLLGLEDAVAFVGHMEGYEAIFITDNREIHLTEGAALNR